MNLGKSEPRIHPVPREKYQRVKMEGRASFPGGNLELTLGIDRMKKVLNKEALSISLEAKEESNETMGGSEEVEER